MSSITSDSTVLVTMALTMSIEVSSGTPLLSSVESVRVKRAMASSRTILPRIGAVSIKRSHQARPSGVWM